MFNDNNKKKEPIISKTAKNDCALRRLMARQRNTMKPETVNIFIGKMRTNREKEKNDHEEFVVSSQMAKSVGIPIWKNSFFFVLLSDTAAKRANRNA